MSTTNTFYGYGFEDNPIETVSAAKTLVDADHGKVFILSAAAGAAITLPSPKPGLKFKFIVGSAFATTDWTVVTAGSSNVIYGNVLVNDAHVPGSQEDTISFVASAESVGDYAEVISDGTNWYVSGSADAAGAITLTQAS